MSKATTGGFRLLPSYYDAIRPLDDKERLALWDALMDYGFTGQMPRDLSPVCNAVFSLIKPIVEKSVKYYEDQHRKAQNRQDAIRQIAGEVPNDCRNSAAIVPNECRNSAGGKAATERHNVCTVRDSESDHDCENECENECDSDVEGETKTSAAALLQEYGIKDKENGVLVNAISGDLIKHGEGIVRKTLSRAKAADNPAFGGITVKFYVRTLLEVLKEKKQNPNSAEFNYLQRSDMRDPEYWINFEKEIDAKMDADLEAMSKGG